MKNLSLHGERVFWLHLEDALSLFKHKNATWTLIWMQSTTGCKFIANFQLSYLSE